MEFNSLIISLLIHFLLLISLLVCPIYSFETNSNQLGEDFPNLRNDMQIRLQHINKPAVKTIHSPDGDIIDCVMIHKQPAFDHPLLKGQKPSDPPERLKGDNQMDNSSDIFQLWSLSGEACPDGTIPIRRIKEEDMLRVNSTIRFERKTKNFKNDLTARHEHSIAYVKGDWYNGAKATLNVWVPHVESQEFSMAQIWVLSNMDIPNEDFESVEAGWQVHPQLYGDNKSRFFIYWTADSNKRTGCYNLQCSGFVQTNNKIALGAAISPTSTYKGKQSTITLSILKDSRNGNWWLKYGSEIMLGYWPSSLFKHLKHKAYMVQFGGEIVNSKSTNSHTSTQMGSGHFAEEGFAKSAYFRNIQIVDSNHFLVPLRDPKYFVAQPNCYNIKGGIEKYWGDYFYYGGPGKNEKCH